MKRNPNIGDVVANIDKGSICTTYPLNEFKNYNGQPRDNSIREGVVLDQTPQ